MLADRIHLSHPIHDDRIGGLIGITRIGVGAFRENAAAVGGGVQHGDAHLGGQVEQRRRGAVQQRIAVVRDEGLEDAGLDVAVIRSTGPPAMPT